MLQQHMSRLVLYFSNEQRRTFDSLDISYSSNSFVQEQTGSLALSILVVPGSSSREEEVVEGYGFIDAV
jgi:hypothetical protein